MESVDYAYRRCAAFLIPSQPISAQTILAQPISAQPVLAQPVPTHINNIIHAEEFSVQVRRCLTDTGYCLDDRVIIEWD
jgi:hypothetical protein